MNSTRKSLFHFPRSIIKLYVLRILLAYIINHNVVSQPVILTFNMHFCV
jgi:type III secretory pathway component EscU